MVLKDDCEDCRTDPRWIGGWGREDIVFELDEDPLAVQRIIQEYFRNRALCGMGVGGESED